MDAYVKRPNGVQRVEFDMRAFAAKVAPQAVTYVLRCEAGLTISDDTTIADLIELVLSDGRAGRVYQFGVEATTADGRSLIDTRLMRIREQDVPPIFVPGGPTASVYADNYADNYS